MVKKLKAAASPGRQLPNKSVPCPRFQLGHHVLGIPKGQFLSFKENQGFRILTTPFQCLSAEILSKPET